MRLAQGRVATVAVNSFVFKQPVFVGDLVSLYAEVVRVGRTSITVSVEVYAQHRGRSEERRESDRGDAHLRRGRRESPAACCISATVTATCCRFVERSPIESKMMPQLARNMQHTDRRRRSHEIVHETACRVAVSAALGSVSPAAAAPAASASARRAGAARGNAFAGGAAAAEDASVVWFNPAGMTALPPGSRSTGALHASSRRSSSRTPARPARSRLPGAGDGGDGGDWAFIPNGFFTMADRAAAGASASAECAVRTEDRLRRGLARAVPRR